MPTARAGGDNRAVVRLRLDLLHEIIADFERELVFRFECAERTSHPAAAGLEQVHFASRQTLGEPCHEAGLHERFCMAMSVDCDVMHGAIVEVQSLRLSRENVVDELLEEKA